MWERLRASLVITMRSCFLVVAVLTACVCAEEFLRPLHGMQGLRITCDSEEKLSLVRSYENHPDFDFLKVTRDLGTDVKVLVTADAVAHFKTVLSSNDIGYTVFDDNVAKTISQDYVANEIARNEALRSKAPGTPFHSYFHRINEIGDYLKELAETNKFVTLLNIGKSYEGKPIYGVKISSGPGEKPAILVDAGIHAREWIAPSTALFAIDQLVSNKTNSGLFENVDWYIIPSLNPDGYDFTWTTNRLWRKTRSVNPGSDCFGTDPNRNFDLKWMTVGASPYPCSEIYAGNSAFSEPETQALRDFVLANKNSIKLYLTLHSYGQYMLHPWGFTSDLPDNEPLLRELAVKAELALRSVYGTPYTIGSSTNVLYAAAGGSDDWVMGVAGVPLSYTIELPGGGSYGFNPHPSSIKPVGIETLEAFRVFAEYVAATYA